MRIIVQRFLKFFLLSLVIHHGCLLSAVPRDTSDVALRILSWNIYCLPAKAIGNPGATKRAPFIGQLLATEDYDVIVFQEAFHPKARGIILRELGDAYPYQIGPVTPSTGFKTNDGIWILSRWPMRFVRAVRFDRSKLPDWFSRRGATLVEIDRDGFVFHILGTHLQSGAGERRDAVRLHQARTIASDLIAPEAQPGIPLILCGDFNTNNLNTIQPMLDLFGASIVSVAGPQEHTWPMPGHGRKRKFLDHIWIRHNGYSPKHAECCIRAFTHPFTLRNRTLTSLSDHYAVELLVTW